jgi:pumilio homology domain family member 6
LDRFNNPDKGAVTHAIVHRALWEYLLAVNDTSDEVEREKLRREMFERFVVFMQFMIFSLCLIFCCCSCQDVLAEMVHTKYGSHVVREFIAQGSAKVSPESPSLAPPLTHAHK